ncbi:MAG: hypothetical protein ACRYFU_16235 [Janthinobacterium lividum]
MDQAAQANELAVLFNDLSQAVDDFRLNFEPPLQSEQMSRLKDESQALEDRAHYFTAQAIGATLAQIAPDLDAIKATTVEAKRQLYNLNSISKAISIATSAVSLGAAIAAGNPAAIAAATEALVQTMAA